MSTMMTSELGIEMRREHRYLNCSRPKDKERFEHVEDGQVLHG